MNIQITTREELQKFYDENIGLYPKEYCERASMFIESIRHQWLWSGKDISEKEFTEQYGYKYISEEFDTPIEIVKELVELDYNISKYNNLKHELYRNDPIAYFYECM